jgi:L-rhamnose isomerase/sugar isomerase
MIDQSHNIKDPIEDLIQSTEAVSIAYAQALLVERDALLQAQDANDAALGQHLLQDAFRIDVRPLVAEARRAKGGAIEPLDTYRSLGYRRAMIEQRGLASVATGL